MNYGMSKNFNALLDRVVHSHTTSADEERLLFRELVASEPEAPLTEKGRDIADVTLGDFIHGNRVKYLPLLDAETTSFDEVRIRESPTNIALMNALGYSGDNLGDIIPGDVVDLDMIQTLVAFQPVESVSELTGQEIAGLGARIGNLPLMRTVVVGEPNATLQF